MTVSRRLAMFIREFLVKQHPYFSCCASCGEIKVPLANRLCTSLAISFPIDIVLLPFAASSIPQPYARAETPLAPSLKAEQVAACTENLQRHAPWVRTIFVIHTEDTPFLLPQNPQIQQMALRSLLPEGRGEPAAYLHSVAALSEHYLVLYGLSSPQTELLPLDFFTPNGLPKLHLKKQQTGQHGGLYPQTKEDSSDFMASEQALGMQGKPYFDSYTEWAYTERRIVPVRFLPGESSHE